MTDRLWVPPSARGATEVTPGVEATAVDGEAMDKMLGPDSTVFLPVKGFGVMECHPTDPRGHVPAVEVEFERLRQQVIDGTARVEFHGIAESFMTDAGEVQLPGGPSLILAMDVTYVIGPVLGRDDTPPDFLMRCMGGWALVFEPLPDGKRPHIITGAMKVAGLAVARDSNRAGAAQPKVGRNQPCPCGSGIKFKLCHGR